MKEDNLKTGNQGEQLAKKYLQDKGYSIIEQNYKNKYAEIDLVVRRKAVLIFVEVRTRSGEQFGSPEESLNRDKMNRMIRNAQAYAARKKYQGQYRLDAVCIVLDKDKNLKRINHYENVTGG